MNMLVYNASFDMKMSMPVYYTNRRPNTVLSPWLKKWKGLFYQIGLLLYILWEGW